MSMLHENCRFLFFLSIGEKKTSCCINKHKIHIKQGIGYSNSHIHETEVHFQTALGTTGIILRGFNWLYIPRRQPWNDNLENKLHNKQYNLD